MTYIIQLENITKRFPGVVANDHISFDIEEGEIHTLAGENGAGKSTLMNIIYGLYRPDEGSIKIHGSIVDFHSSKDSIAAKIGMVHQHFMLVPKLTVTENIIVGQEMGSKFKINRIEAEKKIAALSEKYGLKIDPKEKVGNLSVTEQQRVEILKVLYREAEILIFDEPTAVLTPQEINEFCEILLNLKKSGKTIIFISHKLAEVMKISDRITVIRHGKVVGTVEKKETSPEEITQMMVGRSVDLSRRARAPYPNPKEILRVNKLNYTVDKTVKKLNQVSFTLHAGEILGLAGVDGNGQQELVEMICGGLKPDSGSVCLNGRDITGKSVRARKELGIGYVPEDRHKDGLVLGYSIAENLILGQHFHSKFAKKKKWLNFKAIGRNAERLKENFDIRCANTEVSAGTLSGGNQQKVVIAREASRNPDLFIAVQPTRGLDVGAEEFVHEVIYQQRNQGKAVLLVSFELDEILSISDQIAVMYKGEIVDIVDAEKVSRQELGRMMLGSLEIGKEERNEQEIS